MATNQTECDPALSKRDYAAYVSQGGIQYMNSSVLHHTDTYIHTKSQGTFKTEYDMHTASSVIRCPVVSTEAESMHQNWKYPTVFQCDQAKTKSTNETSSSTVIQ